MKFRQIGHTTIAIMDSRFPLKLLVHGTGLIAFAETPSLAVFRSHFL